MTFWRQFYRAFVRSRGYAVAIAGLVLSILPFVIPPGWDLPLKVAVPVFVILFIIITSLIELSRYVIQEYHRITPAVRQARIAPDIYSPSVALLLLDASPLFGSQSMFSLFHKEDNFEVLIGSGVIIAVQENGLLQALVKQSFTPDASDIWTRINNNDGSILKHLLVKPSIPELIFRKD